MAIFDEPSREPLPQSTFEDVCHAAQKGLLSIVPVVGTTGAELLGLLASPLANRRDAWFNDLERRLRQLEDQMEGFQLDHLSENEEFVSITLQAYQIAMRTHQEQKLEALRNAVLNVAIRNAPSDEFDALIWALPHFWCRSPQFEQLR